MKTLVVISLFFFFCYSFSHAQSEGDVKMIVSYAAKFKYRKEREKIHEDEKILEIGSHYSAFYGLWQVRREEIRDSMIATGCSFGELVQALADSGYPRPIQQYAVYKNFPAKGKLTYTDVLVKKFKYTEDMEKPVWRIVEGDTLIYDYPCQKAVTDFRGRVWTVWFTPSIPVSDGPWKLYGLPGLILKADDSTGEFSFYCMGIKKGDNKKIKKLTGKFIECTPQKLAAMHTLRAKSLEGFLQSLGFPPSKGYGPDGKPLKYKEMSPVFMEIYPK